MLISVELGPGMRFAAPSRSRNLSRVSQPRRRTTSSSIIAMCAAGPPKAVVPRRKYSRASSHKAALREPRSSAAIREQPIQRGLILNVPDAGKQLAHFSLACSPAEESQPDRLLLQLVPGEGIVRIAFRDISSGIEAAPIDSPHLYFANPPPRVGGIDLVIGHHRHLVPEASNPGVGQREALEIGQTCTTMHP